MKFSGIVAYTVRALKFALPAGGLYLIGRLAFLRRRGGNVNRKYEALLLLFVVYLAALIQITCIRSGAHLLGWWTLPHSTQTVQLIPLLQTIRASRAGAWAVIYPVCGNLLWFFPFGFLLPALRPEIGVRRAAVYALLLSAAIETCQWVLRSGISDVDDVLFNVCGALAGYGCFRIWKAFVLGKKGRNGD